MRVRLINHDATQALGRWLATRVRGGQTLSLEGPLGAGKTTLLQGLAEGLGVTQQTTSPTFIVFRVLPIKKAGLKNLVHADAYRIHDAGELAATGFKEYLGRPDSLVVVEWGNRVRRVLPTDTLRIKMMRPSADQDSRLAELPEQLGVLPKKWETTYHA